jgi:hypothetical protein
MEHDLQVWDAPTPPFLERSLVQPKTYTRFQTINLDDITGITFFLWSNKTLEVHAHSRRAPSAQPTFNRLLDWYHPVGGLFEGRSAWVYVPLSRRDPLTHFGCLVSRKSDREVSFLPYQSCFMVCLPLVSWLVIEDGLTVQRSVPRWAARQLLDGIRSRTGGSCSATPQQI